MTPMNALIVDDEPLARQELRSLLARCPSVKVCGEAANARQALKLVRERRPQVLFLDIAMPGCNGFELLETMPLPHPQVIFTTACDQFAIQAFKVNALDYLLKPIEPQRLVEALEKARARISPIGDAAVGTAAVPSDTTVETGLREDDRVFVRDGERCWFVPVRSIRLLEAEDNFTRLYFDQEKPVLCRTLGSLEERLPARLFLRANRSQLINLTFIEAVGPWFNATLKATLRGGPEVQFSRRQAQLFRERLSL